MFVWTVPTIGAAYEAFLPGTAAVLEEMTTLARRGPEAFDAGLPDLWARIPDRTTVDYGILEPSDNVACVPAAFAWADIGSWAALAEARAEDADATGTVVVEAGAEAGVEIGRPAEADGAATSEQGRHVDHDSRDCLVFPGGGRLVATVGLEGLVVVDTGDVVLVMPRERAQDVKHIVAQLKAEGRSDLL
jgi:mannose-1-phosphate guanylyltransferase